MAKGIKTGGRVKGTPNKITVEIREVYKELIEKNLSNVDIWLQNVANRNPDRALNFILRLSEFVIPKLQNTQTEKIEESKLTEEEIDKIYSEMKIEFNEELLRQMKDEGVSLPEKYEPRYGRWKEELLS